MKKHLFILLLILITSCDDGEVIVEDLTFTNVNVEACDPTIAGTSITYTFYKLDRTNNESLSLVLTIPDDLFTADNTYGPYTLNTTNSIEYRKFNGQPPTTYFCNNIPSATPTVSEAFISSGGTVTLQTAAQTQDDNDGIPADLEPLGLDTDGDGIPNFLDVDDDGDNVLTINEGVVIINGVISLTQSRDTDGDGILDYLDNDDDGDGILTIQEDLDRDLDPSNDIPVLNGVAAYLDNTITITATPAIAQYRIHTIQRSASVTITANNLTLTSAGKELIFENYLFGTYVTPVFQLTARPPF